MQQYYQIYFDKVTYNYVTSKVFQDLQGTLLESCKIESYIEKQVAGKKLVGVLQDRIFIEKQTRRSAIAGQCHAGHANTSRHAIFLT